MQMSLPFLSVEMLKEAYMLAVINFKRPLDRQARTKIQKFKVVNQVLLKIHKKQILDPKYTPKVSISRDINDRAYDLQDPSDHMQCVAVIDIQLLMSAEFIDFYQMQNIWKSM